MSVIFELPPELNIYSAMDTREALLAWVATQTADSKDLLEISAAKVSEVDGAGLQLLVALTNMDQPWRLVESSGPFTDACKTMGLASWLDANNLHTNAKVAP